MPHNKHPQQKDSDDAAKLADGGDASRGAAAAPAPEGALPETQSPASEELAKLQAEKDELLKTLVRRQADFENYRKRIERELHEAGHRGVTRLIEDLLPVLDAFERAIAAHDDPAYEEFRKGFELIYRQLWDALARQGVARIEAEGKSFDPHVHQAIERVETEEYADGTVIAALQPGYTLRGRVLRPAAVRVAVHPAGQASSDGTFVN